MKEKGVTACILNLRVLRTKSSILCTVLASNTNFASPTYQIETQIIKISQNGKIKIKNRMVQVKEPAANPREVEPEFLPFWMPEISM